MRSLEVIRHGHVNQFANDYDHVLGFWRDVFDAEVFLEFTEPDFGGANAVYLAGAACFEVFAPTDPDKAIGSSLKRFGQRWHSLEWTVPNLDEAIEIVKERGIRITDQSPGNYIFVHPRDCQGLCLEITPHFFENDPRGEQGWDPAKGANSNPVGLAGGPTVTLCVPDAESSIVWMSDFTGREPSRTHAGTAGTSYAIDFGDHIVEFVTPNDSPQEGDIKAALAARGPSVYAVTLPVRSLTAARNMLMSKGLTVTEIDTPSGSILALDEGQTDGARIQFRDRVNV
ncbi:MAG: VOC family protein [Candidatus Nanopelagicales bacterium]